MNPRVCQLCGKPLSRLRVGGDGDFCSREHRNQHRLRRGMDRLEEANKVTSLMRRRENPRHISAARLMCNTALERRGFYESKQRQVNAAAAFSPVLPGPAAPRITGGGDRCLAPQVSRVVGRGTARWADTSLSRIDGRSTPPAIPASVWRVPVQICQAGLVALRTEAPARRATRRDFGMPRAHGVRVFLGGAAMEQAVPGARGALVLGRQTVPRQIELPPVAGKALRVSVGTAFRVGPAHSRSFTAWTQATAALVWPHTPYRVWPEIQDYVALYRDLAVGISTLRPQLPVVGGAARRAQFVYPGTRPPQRPDPSDMAQAARRASDLSWKLAEPQSRRMGLRPPTAGFGQRNGAHLYSIHLAPTSTVLEHQVAFTSFVPREPVGYPVVAFEGTVAAAITSPGSAGVAPAAEAAAPQPASPAVAIKIEEHFGSGWDNWMGGTKDWKVDVAGVRTGPLALFVPTLELIDYQLEFLARIDTSSVTWVVRAAGLDEYLRCTITAVPGGELEFSRCAVVGGAAQASVTAPQRLPGKPRSTLTVGTRVFGDRFTVTVDGNTIETWNDDRFPMGGVGFQGTPEDRARLYWVRISSTESSAKEHRNK